MLNLLMAKVLNTTKLVVLIKHLTKSVAYTFTVK